MSEATYRAGELHALLEARASVQTVDRGSWKVTAGDSTLVARTDPGWLHFDAESTPAGLNGHAWALLESNARLPAGVKIVVPDHDDTVRVRAELPLDREIALDDRLGAVVDGILAAMDWRSVCDQAPHPGKVADLGDVSERCREAGWSDHDRRTGPFHVDLDHVRGRELARVQRRDDETVQISVDLEIDAAEATPVCNRAVALLLLRVTAEIRMVRAAATANRPRFEVVLDGDPAVAEIGHALSALSVACTHAALEARALHGDEAVARRYLATTSHD